MNIKILKGIQTVLQMGIAIIFVIAGLNKIFHKTDVTEMFTKFDIPMEFMVTIGFTELVLSVLLFVKYFSKLASLSLITILIFGTFFNLMYGFIHVALLNVVIIGIILSYIKLTNRIKEI